MSGETEHGFKWWVRYVIVPIIGGGGVIAIIVALITNSNTSSSPTPTLTSTSPQITIELPNSGYVDTENFDVFGTSSSLPSDAVIWIFTGQVIQGDITRYWPQRGSPVTPETDGTWLGKGFISDDDIGERFEIYAVVVDDPETDKYLQEYVAAVDRGNLVPFLGFPPLTGFVVWDNIAVTRRDVVPPPQTRTPRPQP